MDLQALVNAIGITQKYPKALEEIYAVLSKTDAPACDLKLIEELQSAYNLFEEYYEEICQAAEAINQDQLRSTWVRVAGKFAMEADVKTACTLPCPKITGDPANDFMALFLLIPQIPGSIDQYRRRGFCDTELKDLLNCYVNGIRIVKRQTGYPGINKSYYDWCSIFAKAMIFKTDGLQFELQKVPDSVIWLKEKSTGELMPVLLGGRMSEDGKHRIGAAGFDEDAPSFEITFEEDEENFYGHPTRECVVSKTREVFSKAQWEAYIRPGENCISMHIPQKADISPENTRKACENAKKIARERYPEFSCDKIYCCSWLLDPTLAELQGAKSNITAFQRSFVRYPIKNNGMSVFSFVFPRYCSDYRELPEETSLQKKIKKLYLEGKYIYFVSGIYAE